MTSNARSLRTPEERVGMLPNACLPPPAANETEHELLLRALRERDEDAFAEMAHRYFPAMLRIAMSHVNGREAAEDVIQETWLAAIEGVSRFEGRSSAKTWLFHILRNIALARSRKDGRLRTLSELDTADDDATRTDPVDRIVDARTAAAGYGHAALWTRATDPEQQLLARELADRVDTAIRSLPERQQEVIVMRDVEGFSAAEVCNILGISDTNQRVILHRARDRVRNELQEYVVEGECCGGVATVEV